VVPVRWRRWRVPPEERRTFHTTWGWAYISVFGERRRVGIVIGFGTWCYALLWL
jgi:hypothetical protein